MKFENLSKEKDILKKKPVIKQSSPIGASFVGKQTGRTYWLNFAISASFNSAISLSSLPGSYFGCDIIFETWIVCSVPSLLKVS